MSTKMRDHRDDVLLTEAITPAETEVIVEDDSTEVEVSLEGLIEAEDSTRRAELTQQRPMMHITVRIMLTVVQTDNQEVKVTENRLEENQTHTHITVYLERTIMKMT